MIGWGRLNKAKGNKDYMTSVVSVESNKSWGPKAEKKTTGYQRLETGLRREKVKTCWSLVEFKQTRDLNPKVDGTVINSNEYSYSK